VNPDWHWQIHWSPRFIRNCPHLHTHMGIHCCLLVLLELLFHRKIFQKKIHSIYILHRFRVHWNCKCLTGSQNNQFQRILEKEIRKLYGLNLNGLIVDPYILPWKHRQDPFDWQIPFCEQAAGHFNCSHVTPSYPSLQMHSPFMHSPFMHVVHSFSLMLHQVPFHPL